MFSRKEKRHLIPPDSLTNPSPSRDILPAEAALDDPSAVHYFSFVLLSLSIRLQ